jgi:pimeloyl-ACP methyl ester carboxylesterase
MRTPPLQRSVTVCGGRLELGVEVIGSGPPLVYLHPAGGLAWDPFLETLSERYTIVAPEFPGTTSGASLAIHELDDIFDVVLAYEEAMHALDVVGAPVIGQSFGGMLAAELASTFPALFAKVVLLDPAGLWLPEHPFRLDFMSCPPQDIPAMLFADPSGAAAQAMFAPPSDPAAALDRAVALVWAMGCTAKFLWPIPDRGLDKRLHRLAAPTLVVWGEQDALIPVVYAHEFGRRIADCRVELVADCGHIPQVEQAEVTLALVADFLG